VACVAEELALRAILGTAQETYAEDQGVNGDFGWLWETGFLDNDYEFLFEPASDGVEDTEFARRVGLTDIGSPPGSIGSTARRRCTRMWSRSRDGGSGRRYQGTQRTMTTTGDASSSSPVARAVIAPTLAEAVGAALRRGGAALRCRVSLRAGARRRAPARHPALATRATLGTKPKDYGLLSRTANRASRT
jgi:hypothetical protein